LNYASSINQSIKLVRRELRGGLRGFGVFLTCLFLGVFAISAIGSFTESAKSGLLADAGALLGGDLEVRLAHRELPGEALSFLAERGQLSHVMTMRTMVIDKAGDQRVLAELKAVDSAYPLYGQVHSDPPQTTHEALGSRDEFGALVEAPLLARLNVKVGDKVKVGTAEFLIKGIVTTEPDRTVRPFNLGPRFMTSIEGLKATGLLQPGSLVYHAYRLRLPDRETVDQLKAEIQSRFPEAGWRLRSWREATPRVRFFLDRMNQNMTLLGLCALLVGGLGVSGAVRGYLDGKITHIATMKCLGAPGQLIFNAYLLQVLFLGFLGSTAGLIAGAALPFILSQLIGKQLPVPLAPAIHWSVLLTAALFGLLIALAFSLKALGIARQVSPSVLFRGYVETGNRDPGTGIKVAITLTAISLAALAVLTSSDQKLAFWFICGAVLCFGIFRYAAATVIRLTRLLPKPNNPSLRLGLGNIHRRGSPAGSALFSLGLGLTALVTIMLVQANLDDKINETVPREAPSFFFLDLQTDQVEAFEMTARNLPGLTKLERYPTLRGRITAIADQPVSMAKIAQGVRWAVRGDRFLSYSAVPPKDTQVVAGEWWPEDYEGEPLVSITADLAKGFGVSIGDTLTVNVLGRDVTATISSLREVDWSTLDLNFALIFSPGVLESAPQTNIASVHVPADQEEVAFATITRQFPNVSAISTREILKNVTRTLERIGTAFRSMAALAVLTGFLVLAGAVSADQHRRIHDAVIFKVCGATRRDILGAFAAEFLFLGMIAGVISSVVGSLAAMGILKGLMKMSFTLHPGTIITTILTGIALTLLLGLLGTWKALGHKPAAYLRTE
jgi:putative ABC transport system permease protein